MSKELDAARRVYLKALADEFKASTHDKLFDLIENAREDLNCLRHDEWKTIIEEIRKDAQVKYGSNFGNPDMKEKISQPNVKL